MTTETLTIEKIKSMRAAITKPPWVLMPPLCGPDGQGVYQLESVGTICEVGDPYPRGDNCPQENMEFIAASPEIVDFLLEEIAERDKHIIDLNHDMAMALKEAD